MRCEDLTRELASPTGGYTPAEMAGHLAACPGCVERSRQADRFDRIWEATRPTETPSLMMDALWAQASASLEAQTVPATLRLEGVTPRRSWLKPALVFAQAAALLFAVGYVLTRSRPVEPVQVADATIKVTPPTPVQPTAIAETKPADDANPLAVFTLNVNEGETPVVKIPVTGAPEVKLLTQTVSEQSTALPLGTPFDVFNAAEVMAEPPVVVSAL